MKFGILVLLAFSFVLPPMEIAQGKDEKLSRKQMAKRRYREARLKKRLEILNKLKANSTGAESTSSGEKSKGEASAKVPEDISHQMRRFYSNQQGVWFMSDIEKSDNFGSSNVEVSGIRKEARSKNGRSVARYTVADAEARLKSAKERLANDLKVLDRLRDQADPQKLSLWEARIQSTRDMILEKEEALAQLKENYLRKVRENRDQNLYERQGAHYDSMELSMDFE